MTLPPPPTPGPLTETPPADRFCDLILNGGIASGVAYPWAILALARHYRFRHIGGNSVGAMAGALAAAAEYGRCHGLEDPFEPLRKMPLKLAETDDAGRTTMFRLFQPEPALQRLFDLFLAAVRWGDATGRHGVDAPARQRLFRRLRNEVLDLFGLWRAFGAACFMLALAALWPLLMTSLLAPSALPAQWQDWAGMSAAALVGWGLVLLGTAALGALLFCLLRLLHDLRALARWDFGLCTGLGQPGQGEGLVQWLHRGIQLSAGRGEHDPPLTFADLWRAPRFGRAGPEPAAGGLQPPEAGIDLQMFTSNVTLGRPVRLPLLNDTSRLYYDPAQWARFFPRTVLCALKAASTPYVPASASDPPRCDPQRREDDPQESLKARLRELPSGGMPIVVAARMSLSFPLLFACLPVYAVDYEAPRGQRVLRLCRLSDGGLCSNFPIHLFDAALPRWPTFALLLDRRLKRYQEQPFWRPETHRSGRADNWLRGVPGAESDDAPARGAIGQLLGLGLGMLTTMKDWNDRMTGRLPQVRNRMVRLALQPGEGQFNLQMTPETMMRMAHVYGTQVGEDLVSDFVPAPRRNPKPGEADNPIKPAWQDHLYVRALVELRALHQHLRGFSRAAGARGHTLPIRQVLDDATRQRALFAGDGPADPAGGALTQAQCDALKRAIDAVETLEAELDAAARDFGPYEPVPEPQLRLRPPV